MWMIAPQTPATTRRPSTVHIRIPALDDERCPHCGAENVGQKVYVWRAADERGPHLECDVCAKEFRMTQDGVIITVN